MVIHTDGITTISNHSGLVQKSKRTVSDLPVLGELERKSEESCKSASPETKGYYKSRRASEAIPVSAFKGPVYIGDKAVSFEEYLGRIKEL